MQGCEFSGVNHYTVADEANLGLLHHLAVADDATRNGTDLGNLEGLLNLGGGDNLFLLLRLKHTLDTILDIVDTVVDDGVEADFYTLLLGGTAGIHGRTHLEADNHGIGSLGKQDVGLGDTADSLMDYIDLHFLGGELDE